MLPPLGQSEQCKNKIDNGQRDSSRPKAGLSAISLKALPGLVKTSKIKAAQLSLSPHPYYLLHLILIKFILLHPIFSCKLTAYHLLSPGQSPLDQEYN